MRIVAGAGGILALAIAVAWLLAGVDEAIRGGLATAICLPLAALSLELSGRSLPHGFNWQFGVMVGGAGARISLVLIIAGLFFWFVPICGRASFWLWIGAAYVLTLSIEIVLLISLLRRWTEMNRSALEFSGA